MTMEPTTLESLKVGWGADTAQADRLATVREGLPHQTSALEAALRFGLPMTGREIHERVRATLPQKWRLPFPARVGVALFSILALAFAFLAALAGSYVAACRSSCSDPIVGLTLSLAVLVGSIVAVGGIFGSNVQVFRRTSLWHRIDQYPRRIPDAALLKFADAKASGLFTAMYVVEAGYETPPARLVRHADPWLVGFVGRDPFTYRNEPTVDDHQAYVVLAYWE